MAKINSNFRELHPSYLFCEVAKKVRAFSDSHPEIALLKLGVGSTTEPIVPVVIDGLRRGVLKLSARETYTGYGDEQGDERLRKAISAWYGKRNLEINPSEIFISDGAKTDCSNISSLFSSKSVVAVSDPVYPVYLDSSILNGRKIVFMAGTEKNGFVPSPPVEKTDIIFLCSPNNPTGTCATKNQLQAFVEYALKNRAVIIFDAAYSEYIRDSSLPKSIYEIEGAKKCAIEIQSFSKSSGFTGVRLGWTVVPKALVVEDSVEGELNQFWNRRQTTMFNGASNIAQEGGLAILSVEGLKECRLQIDYYLENAKIIREGLTAAGQVAYGGVNAPYIWLKCPSGFSSWEFFDELLYNAQVVTTPGSGFGENGEGFLRLSAFGHREDIEKAVHYMQKHLKNITRV